MEHNTNNLDYIILGVDISEKELEDIIDETDEIISNANNSDKDKLIEAYLKKVQCLQKLNKYTESKKILEKELLRLNPNMPEALVRLGNIYDKNKKQKEAIEKYTTAIDLKKDYAYAYWLRGNIHYDKGNYDDALKDYKDAIDNKPDFSLAYSYLGWTYYKKGEYDIAKEKLNYAIEIKNCAIAFNGLGAVFFDLAKNNGDEELFKESFKNYAKATNINPKYDAAFNNWKMSLSELAELKKDKKPFKNPVVKSAYEDYDTRILCAAYERLHLVLGDKQKFPDFDKEVSNFLVHINDNQKLSEFYLIMSSIEYLNKEAPSDEQNLFMVIELIEAGINEYNYSNESDLDRLINMLKEKDTNHIAVRHYDMFHFLAGEKVNDIIDSCRRHFSAISSNGNMFKYVKNDADIEILAKIIEHTNERWTNNDNKTYNKSDFDLHFDQLKQILAKLYYNSKTSGIPVKPEDIDIEMDGIQYLKEFYKGCGINEEPTTKDRIIHNLNLMIKGLSDSLEYKSSNKGEWWEDDEIKLEKVATGNTEYDELANQGNELLIAEKYNEAIEKHNEAIKKDENLAEAKKCQGVAYVFKGISEEEKEKEKNFIEAAARFYNAKVDILKVLNLSQGETIVKIMLDKDEFFNETVVGLSEDQKDTYKGIYIQSLKLIAKLQIREEEMPVSHYTPKWVSEKLLFDDYNDKEKRSLFRLSSLNTSNDLSEGKILFQYLFGNEDYPIQVDDFGAFAGCFAFNGDCLNQFRLYGKDQKEEGTGVSITLNEQFFSEEVGIIVETKSKEGKLPLFRCIYIDPKTNKIISLGQKEEEVFYRENENKEDEDKVKKIYQEYKSKIDKTQQEVCEDLEQLKIQVEKLANYNIAYKLLLNLRYLVKHAAFKEEQECRIIQIKKVKDDEVEKDENNCFYIDYQKLNENNVDKICFAPKVKDKDIDKFKQHLARNKYDKKECYRSKAPLA